MFVNCFLFLFVSICDYYILCLSVIVTQLNIWMAEWPYLTKALFSIESSDTLYSNEPPDLTLKKYLHLTTDQPGPKIRFCLNHRTHPLPLKSPNSIVDHYAFIHPTFFCCQNYVVTHLWDRPANSAFHWRWKAEYPWNRVLVGLLLWYCGSQHGISGHKREANLGKGQRGGFLQPYHSFAIPSHQFPFS